jgi:hypothetical protein
MSLALLPGKEENTSETGHRNLAPLGWGEASSLLNKEVHLSLGMDTTQGWETKLLSFRGSNPVSLSRGPRPQGVPPGTVSVPHVCPVSLKDQPPVPPGDPAVRANSVCQKRAA